MAGYSATKNDGVVCKTTDGGNTWNEFSSINAIYHLTLIDSVNLFSGGFGIIKTTNGNSWSQVSHGLMNTLNTLFFINENTGWIAGGDGYAETYGVLIKTTDGGNNWMEFPAFDNDMIYSLCFINSNTGWAAGTNSTIKKSTDGGNNWVTIVPPAGMKFTKILFIDSLNGWLTGFSGYGTWTTAIYKSTNGGLNWNQQFSAYGYELDALSFLNSQTGYAGGGWPNMSGKVLKTTNGGNDWIETNLNSTHKILSIDFMNELTGWAAGGEGHGFIYRTTNGGQNWNMQYDTLFNEVNSISFTDENHGWAAGRGDLFFTTDGGYRWSRSFSGSDFIQTVQFVNQNTGWIAGYYGVVLKTTNGGSVFVNNNSLVVPEGYELFQNYPNPFNPSTMIEYSIPKECPVSIIVYDITGREIETLVNEVKRAGYYTVQFNTSRLSSGIYFYRITAGDFTQTKKMILLK